MKKPSSATSNSSQCVFSQSIIVILVPFSNLNRTFAMGILFRSVFGLLDTTSMGIPTLSLQVEQILTFDKLYTITLSLVCTVQATVMLVCLVITNAQVCLSLLVIKVLIR